MNLFLTRLVPAGFLCASSCFAVDSSSHPQGADYEKVVKPFFQQHCNSCHGEKKQKGDLRVDTLSLDFKTSRFLGHWTEIMDRINSGDMPPEDEPQPKPEEIAKVSEWISTHLTEADAVQKSGGGEKVAFRRLTREEYGNTIRDLLGVTYDATAPTALPEEPDWQGFQRIGSVLGVSPAHIEKYLSAAETILDEALALGERPKKELIHWNPFDIRSGWNGVRKKYQSRGNFDKVRVDLVPNNGADGTPGGNKLLVLKATGEYIVRLKFSALRAPNGIPPRLRLHVVDLDRYLYERDVEAPEDQPMTVEFRAHLPAGSHPVRIVNAVPGPNPEGRQSRPLAQTPYTSLKKRLPWQLKLTDENFQAAEPIILLDSVEWEGPIQDQWPPLAHQRIFFGGENATKDLAYAREILARFAERAWRRPVQSEEVDHLVKVAEQSLQLGDNFETSVRSALLAVLCSKNFIYLQEGSIQNPASKLTDFELASRLSYFLWSTMPDDHLLELARSGKLHQPETLRAEVRRMINDPKIEAFAKAYPQQWLQLRHVGMFPPDKKLYPEYDAYLEKSMLEETTTFFREVMTKNLPLSEFLDSDWTMLNRRLATFYGIPDVQGEELKRVALRPEDNRGGLLTQAAILSLTSDGTRHRPIHRGKWLLESIIGKPSPPPPPNVSAIEPGPADKPKTTLRAKLEAHLNDASCASCHKKLDPYGLAFENYDAIGRWRTEEVMRDGAGANPKVDSSGVLVDGRTFENAAGLKKILTTDVDVFATAFTEKLAIYGLRRSMTFADRDDISKIVQQTKTENYKLQSVMEALVMSELFQSR